MSDNIKTLIYATVMTLIVAVSLAGVTSWLKPIQKIEMDKDKKINILKAVKFNEDMDPEAEYAGRIKELVINNQGEVVSGIKAFDLNLKKEYAKNPEERNYPLYVYTSDSKEKKYIVPLIGTGLWDEINGFIALKDDFVTLDGASFGHVGETPGLGAEISTDWFQSQFKSKQISNAAGKYVFKVLKGRGNKLTDNTVDGITGATITCDGLAEMMEKCYNGYSKYFKSASSGMPSSRIEKTTNKTETTTKKIEKVVSQKIQAMSNNLFAGKSNVNFIDNSTIISDESSETLDALTHYLSANPNKRVEILVEDTKGNFNLANRRAESVFSYALKQGANPKQLDYKAKISSTNSSVNFKLLK